MTSSVAAANGWLSHGPYRGIASIIAGMLQANPALTPLDVRGLLLAATEPVPVAPAERPGHGAIQGGQAVALAVASRAGWPLAAARSPVVSPGRVLFRLHAAGAQAVRVLGSWDGWKQPGISLEQVAPGWWQGQLTGSGAGVPCLV
jgi:hypothetical protein